MLGRLFDHPLYLVILLVIILLLFGAPKLPGMARSLGQSMRIFKSEVKEMKDDKSDKSGQEQKNSVVNGEVVSNGDVDSNGSHAPGGATAEPNVRDQGTSHR
ncbi:Sec-independent protein translocase subunit TatA [uncultured Kocuria sp.]|uniref:Sec-independent protein translocase subunit TatA n=1 Tax=uncultured Kocuria sp. TaxID=259305 RepID=UPI00259AC219|nr:Sec-independent protein translocase subunit TatA [uncultured Kocuria sp.]MCT1366820.1 Sec-independent protein translocase subunit TatA [Rothia sp. p3-SID1597]